MTAQYHEMTAAEHAAQHARVAASVVRGFEPHADKGHADPDKTDPHRERHE